MIQGTEKAANALEKVASQRLDEDNLKAFPGRAAIIGGVGRGLLGGILGGGAGLMGGGLYHYLARDEEEQKRKGLLRDLLMGGALGGLGGAAYGGVTGYGMGKEYGGRLVNALRAYGGMPETPEDIKNFEGYSAAHTGQPLRSGQTMTRDQYRSGGGVLREDVVPKSN